MFRPFITRVADFEKSLQDTWSVKMKDLFYRAMLLKRTVQAEDYQNPPEETANLYPYFSYLSRCPAGR